MINRREFAMAISAVLASGAMRPTPLAGTTETREPASAIAFLTNRDGGCERLFLDRDERGNWSINARQLHQAQWQLIDQDDTTTLFQAADYDSSTAFLDAVWEAVWQPRPYVIESEPILDVAAHDPAWLTTELGIVFQESPGYKTGEWWGPVLSAAELNKSYTTLDTRGHIAMRYSPFNAVICPGKRRLSNQRYLARLIPASR